MNTPTPRTDKVVASDMGDSGFFADMIKHARQLERELNEARQQQEAKVTPALVMDYARVQAERDQLRKMLDAFAECVGHGDEWLMADYRELPHVRARKTK